MAIDDRTKLLLKDNFVKISNLSVAIIGIGGVGSIIPDVLVRSGVNKILIVDKDIVDSSNLNRQLSYDNGDIGKPKVEALSKKLFNLRKTLQISTIFEKIDENFNFSSLKSYDFVVDAIDDLNAKTSLIKYCFFEGIPFVSSLGMGNKIDSTKVEITKINKTTEDPLARKLRHKLKEAGVDLSKVNVCFSKEKPITTGKIISSIATVPNAAGLAIASYIIQETCKKE